MAAGGSHGQRRGSQDASLTVKDSSGAVKESYLLLGAWPTSLIDNAVVGQDTQEVITLQVTSLQIQTADQ